MAVIYSYPQLDSLDGSELLICSQTSEDDSTRTITTAAFGAYIQSTYGPGNNIYQADGGLTSDRTISGAGKYLHINNLSNFTVGTSGDINLDPTGNVVVGDDKGITVDNPTGGIVALTVRSNTINNITWKSTFPGNPPTRLALSAIDGTELNNGTGDCEIKNNLAIMTGTGNDIADINAGLAKVLVTKEWVANTYPGTVTSVSGTAGRITSTGGATPVIDIDAAYVAAIANGGTGNTTAQAAIDALSQVAGATNEHVLTKDTGTGNAIWKVASGGSWTRVTETTALRASANGEFILVDVATCDIYLPAPVDNARVAVKVIETPVNVQVKTNALGVEIDGTDYSAVGLSLTTKYEQVSFISDGTNWYIY